MTEMTEDECTFLEKELKKESQMLVPNRERKKQALNKGTVKGQRVPLGAFVEYGDWNRV